MDERNFRSAYYEKVGFKSVEEKKSLEMLLKEKTLDLGKLKQFCLRFSTPAGYRNYMWKVMLGIIPVQTNIHKEVMRHRKQECDDLRRGLLALKEIAGSSPKHIVFLKMWLLANGRLYFNHHNSYKKSAFGDIAKSIVHMRITDDDTDMFWISRRVYDVVQKFQPEKSRLIDTTLCLLEKEDPQFYNHLLAYDMLDSLPIATWFECCFAGVINDRHLEKIWDKFLAGSYKILIFVVVSLLTTLKQKIIACKDNDAVMDCIKNVSEETADVIVIKSIDMWQQCGSPLTLNDKTKTSDMGKQILDFDRKLL